MVKESPMKADQSSGLAADFRASRRPPAVPIPVGFVSLCLRVLFVRLPRRGFSRRQAGDRAAIANSTVGHVTCPTAAEEGYFNEDASGGRVHADRVTRGDCYYCHTGRDPVSGLRAGSGGSPAHGL